MFDRALPHNALPLLPPEGVDLETKSVLKRAIAANRALAELKGAGTMIPNQALLVRIIGLQEAKQSSEIENIVTTNDELYRAFAEDAEKVDPQTKEVLRYNDALWHGYSTLKAGRPLTTTLFEEIAQIIKANTAGVRRNSGTRIASSIGEIIYTPPDGEAIIRDKLANLEQFLYGPNDLDPLVKLAVLHYQFEAIHPFSDGNGRAGRILNILYLIEADLLQMPVLYLSRYIIKYKSLYYEGLRRVTEEQDWENWILFMLHGIEETAVETHRRIQAIRDLMLTTQERVKNELPKIYSKDLVELLFEQPYCRIKFLEQAGIVGSRQRSGRYLKDLANAGFLTQHVIGREVYYVNDAFLELLTR